jgi:hypothetical protein
LNISLNFLEHLEHLVGQFEMSISILLVIGVFLRKMLKRLQVDIYEAGLLKRPRCSMKFQQKLNISSNFLEYLEHLVS